MQEDMYALSMCSSSSGCVFIQFSDAQCGTARVLHENRRRIHVADFSNRVLLHWPHGAAHAPCLPSMKAMRPQSMPQFIIAGTGPRALGTPPWVPRGWCLWRDILTQHDDPIVHIADRSWPTTGEAQTSFPGFWLLLDTEHLKISETVSFQWLWQQVWQPYYLFRIKGIVSRFLVIPSKKRFSQVSSFMWRTVSFWRKSVKSVS